MITIIVADDHKIIREGICNLLNGIEGVKVVGQAENGRKALSLAREHNPDVVIMDIGMPELNGIDAAAQILAEVRGVKVIALSMYADKRYVLGMLKAGVVGYLIKDCAFQELAEAIAVVYRGGTYLSPGISDTIRKTMLSRIKEDAADYPEELTSRERQVLQRIAEGVRTRDIAEEMCLSVKTIETYRSNIMHKLELFSVAELTKYAVREGLTGLD